MLRNAVRRRARAGLDEYLGPLGLGDRRLVGQHPLVGVAAADEAALAQRAQGERDGGAPGADEAAELLLGDRQAQDDAVGADVAAAVGQVPEQAMQAILDARQVAEGERDGGAPRALVDAVDQAGGERRIARDALGEGGVEDEQARGLEDLPARLEADDPLLGAVVGPEQVALGHELGAEGLGALEVAHEQAAQHEQAVAAADALGGRVGVQRPRGIDTQPATAAARASARSPPTRRASSRSASRSRTAWTVPCPPARANRLPAVDDSETKATVAPSIPS